jgi:DNA-binding SARP family transcriptional activator
VEATAVDVTAQLSPRMLEVLAYLAVHPDGVRRDAVVAALWPDTGRHRPANNLSALLTRLRAALAHPAPREAHRAPSSAGTAAASSRADVVILVGDRYRLDPDQITVDYWTFLAMTGPRAADVQPYTAGGRGPDVAVTIDGETLAALHTAHELYRGPLADGLDAEWVLSVREAARRSYLDATARLVRHYAATSPAVALQLLETARNLDPTNENLYRDIIALQLRAGDKHAADNTLRLLETQLADIDEVVSEPVTDLARNIGHPNRE